VCGWEGKAWAGGLQLSPDTRLNKVKKALQPKRIALLIGVSSYTSRAWSDLRFPRQDAAKVQTFLQRDGGFDELHVLTLAKQTTRKGIVKGLQWLKRRNLSSQDTVLVYVSGHGTVAQRRAGLPLERYLVTSDSTRNVAKTGLALSVIRGHLQRLPARRKAVILATCYIGQVRKKRKRARVKGQHSGAKGQYRLGWVSRSTLVLSAAGYMQPAYELEQLKGDVYTHFLLACAKEQLKKDGHVTAVKAHQCATPKTYRYVRKILGREQTPAIEARIMGRDQLFLAGAKASVLASAPVAPVAGWLKVKSQPYKTIRVRPFGSKGGERTLWEQSSPGEGTLVLRLPPGEYELRLFSPSGRMMTRRVRIRAAETTELGPAASPLSPPQATSTVMPFEPPGFGVGLDVGPEWQLEQRFQVSTKLWFSTWYGGGGIVVGFGGVHPNDTTSDVLIRFGLVGQAGIPVMAEPFDFFFGVYLELGLWSPYVADPKDMVFLFQVGPQARIRWWVHEQFALRLTAAFLFSMSPDAPRNPNDVIVNYDWTIRPHFSLLFGFEFGIPGVVLTGAISYVWVAVSNDRAC
jgi:hypothetical protein